MKHNSLQRRAILENLECRAYLNTPTAAIEALTPRSGPVIYSAAKLSLARRHISAVAVGTKAYFAGGDGPGFFAFSHVMDVYDSIAGRWSVIQAPDYPNGPGTAVGDTGLFPVALSGSTNLDLYNSQTATWTQSPATRGIRGGGAATVGNTAVFVGSHDTVDISNGDRLDIFDGIHQSWSSVSVPFPLVGQLITSGSKVVGPASSRGVSGKVNTLDIYDAGTGQASSVAAPNGAGIGAAVGSKIYFASGQRMNVYDTVTGRWKFIKPPSSILLNSKFVGSIGSTVVFNRVLVDRRHGQIQASVIYNTHTGKWFVGPSAGGSAAAKVGHQLLFAGGEDFTSYPLLTDGAVDIYTDRFPTAIVSGGMIAATSDTEVITVYNTGDAALPAGYTVDLYASPGRTLRRAILIGKRRVSSSLAAGGSSPFNIRTVIPKGMAAGSYHLLAAVQDNSGNITPIAAQDRMFRVRGAHITDAARHSRSHP
jgi:hypothetical protein